MRSDTVKRGFERAPHRSLLKATDAIRSDGDFDIIGISNSSVDLIPGHVHLHAFGQVAKEAVREAGGVPFELNTIGVDDGHRQALPRERLRRRRAGSRGKKRPPPSALCFPMPACLEGASLSQSPSSG